MSLDAAMLQGQRGHKREVREVKAGGSEVGGEGVGQVGGTHDV